MPTAIIFVWGHELNAVTDCGFAIGRPLEALGYDVTYVDTSNTESIRSAFKPSIVESDVAISVGSIPLSFMINDQWLFQVFGKRFIMWILDPIYYDILRVNGVLEYLHLSRTSARLKFASPDKVTADLINEFSPGSTFFFPFGGFYKDLWHKREAKLPRVAVIGTIGNELGGTTDADIRKLLEGGRHFLQNGTSADELARFIEAPSGKLDILFLAKERFHVARDRLFARDVCKHLAEVDSYQKRRRRIRTLQSLSGAPLDFYGTGWENYRTIFRDANFLGTISHEKIANVCDRYTTLLNFDPNWDHGLHHRAYTALGHGCRVLTNSSQALQDLPGQGRRNVIEFDANEPQFDDVESLLEPADMSGDELLEFRAETSFLKRMDKLLYDLNTSPG